MAFSRRTAVRRLVSTTLTLSLGFAFSGSATAQQGYALREAGKLTIANGGTYPPMEFMENGRLVGYDVDLGNEIAKRMGLQAEFVVVEYKGIIGTLKSKRTDILISSMTITPARAEQVLFTQGYLDAPIGAAVARKNAGLKADAISADMTVGVEVGSAGAAWARDNIKNTSKVRTYDTLRQAVSDLNAGRVDLVVNNIPALRHQIKDMAALTVTPNWDERVAGIAVRQEDKALAEKINSILADMRTDGFKARLDAKWFGSGK